MPTGVFPYHPHRSSKERRKEGATLLREYDDGSYREYRQSSGRQAWRDLVFTLLSDDEKATIDTFFNARRAGGSVAAREFYWYDYLVVDEPDLTGVSSTGKRVALFLTGEIEWQTDGECRHSATIRIKLVG